ncbi:MAG TPA: winged helix-turn-helix transcriptional regulator, partial [Xanthomonadales bacterium]|nr:winged helix-turn-helix transcriptional regulator [Xanthomonadales bacterium]
MGEWTVFSNHGHVLVCLANNNQARLRDVAASVGITERAVQNILRELQKSGLVQVNKHGRCNHYQINTRKSLRHPLESHVTVGRLLQILQAESGAKAAEAIAEPVKAAQKPSRAKPVKPKVADA